MHGMTIYDRWDQFMAVLSAQPRRQIVASLMEASPERPLPDAAITPDVPPDPERYRVTLRNRHLPTLADAEYVRWTGEPFQVRRGPRFDEPAAVMRALLSPDPQLPSSLTSNCVEGDR